MIVPLLAAAVLGQSSKVDGLYVGFARAQYDAPALSMSSNAKLVVSFFNGSNKPIVLLTERCSWGYESVSFELTNPAGTTYSIVRKQKPWFKNAPSPVTVEPGGVLLRPVNFGDGTWQGFPAGVAGSVDGWKVRVKETVNSDNFISNRGYWTGQVTSRWSIATP